MKKKDWFKDLTKKTVKDLIKMRNDCKKDNFELKTKNSLRWLKQTHLIKLAKKNVARVNTALSNKLKENNGNNR